MPLRCLLFAGVLLAARDGHAADQSRPMNEEEIRRVVADATITGQLADGTPFSEFHARDGRVFGNAGYSLNTDACWTTKADRICYSYGPSKDRRTYCFTMELKGDTVALRMPDTGQLNALGKVTVGNTKGHSDDGKPWDCAALISQKFAPNPQVAAR